MTTDHPSPVHDPRAERRSSDRTLAEAYFCSPHPTQHAAAVLSAAVAALPDGRIHFPFAADPELWEQDFELDGSPCFSPVQIGVLGSYLPGLIAHACPTAETTASPATDRIVYELWALATYARMQREDESDLPSAEDDIANDSSRGFADLDEAPAPEALIDYLVQVGQDPFTQLYYAESRRLLALRPGEAMLEVGCGTFPDLPAVLQNIGNGEVIAADRSAKVLANLTLPSSPTPPVHICVTDAHSLTLAEDSVDRVRACRVFQHLPDPKRALAELLRVARIRACLIEPDWTAFQIEGPEDSATSALVCTQMAAVIQNPALGAELPEMLRTAGFVNIVEQIMVRRLEGEGALAAADQLYGVGIRVQELIGAGLLDPTAGANWYESCVRCSSTGELVISLPLHVVSGDRARGEDPPPARPTVAHAVARMSIP